MVVINAVSAQFRNTSVFFLEHRGVENNVRKIIEVVGDRRQLSYDNCNYTFYCIAV